MSLAAEAQTQHGTDEKASLKVRTRFGTYAIDEERIIIMPRGPFGFEAQTRFVLLPLPAKAPSNFLLYQGVDDDKLSFIVALMDDPSAIRMAEKDASEAASLANVNRDDATFLFIVTINNLDGLHSYTANVRAPIVLDAYHRAARQVVVSNAGCAIQQPL